MLFNGPMKRLSDETLMSKAKGGNVRAMEEIYNRYSQPLLRYFYRMLWQDKNKAQDFLQDFFIRILERQDQFNEGKRFSTWCYSIANNMCKNEYRKQTFRSAVEQRANGHEIMDESITLQLDRDSFQKKLEEILSGEDEELRTIFILRHELDMTCSEIGEIIRCPEGTVKSRLFYLKKKIASDLGHYKMVLEK